MNEIQITDKKYKWDLSVIYKTESDFHSDFSKAEKMIKSFSANEKTMSASAENLFKTLKESVEIDNLIDKLWAYAHLSFCLDMSDNTLQSASSKVRNLYTSYGEAAWFVEPYILKIGEAKIEKWICEYPPLEKFSRLLKKVLRTKPHTLTDENEKLISTVSDTFGSHSEIRGIFANSDLRFGKITGEDGKRVELTDTNYTLFLHSQNRKVRQSAFKATYKTYGQFKNTFATLYNSKVKESTTLAKLRGYKDSLTASTFHDEITPEIYKNLINTIEKGLLPLYDYYDIKREVLGVDKLHLYDVYTPLVKDLDKEYSYEDAVFEVLETVKVFGEEYHTALKEGLCERGWADVYPRRGKRSGAFSSGSPQTEPYILLNFNGKYNDVSTLAHEAGHSMHTWFSTHYNESHNSNYRIFVAEVASTVNELLLAHRKLSETESKNEKLYILNQLIETYKGTMYRQTMFAAFEKEMHALSEKGEPLTADLISKRYYRLVKKYFGKNVVCDKDISLEWARVPHFFSPFYVYKYATSIAAASAIVKRIENDGEEYVKKYIDFLKCGDSKSPLESLLLAEIDMREAKVIEDAIEDFSNCVKAFREIMTT